MAGFDQMRRDLRRQVDTTARNTARDWQRRLRDTSPRDTGNMVNQTTVRARATNTGAEIDALVDTDYAHIVASGQRPHVIRGRNGNVLRFVQNGQVRYAYSVNHPGAQPDSWWDDAYREVPDMLQRNWRGASS